MPSSRKRAKGRARKATKAALSSNDDSSILFLLAEKAKITNGQIARIQQLKDEHSQYKAELQTSRVRMDEVVEENNLLTDNLRAATDTNAQLTTKLEKAWFSLSDLSRHEIMLERLLSVSRAQNRKRGRTEIIQTGNYQ